MSVQERINRQGLRYIGGLQHTAKRLWESACKFEGIDPASKFVQFSADNKYADFHNRVMIRYQEAVSQYKAGGYVGLEIGKRTV